MTMKGLWKHVAMACVFFASAVSVAEQPVLRVLTYNIHHGRGTDGRIDLPRIAAVIRRLKPDLVALQEVDRMTQRCGQVDQAAELGRLTGMHHAFGKAMDFDGGQYGEAVLSRFEFIQVETFPLLASAGHEPRAALAVTVHPANLPAVTFVGTHLDHTREPQDRITQARALNKQFAEQKNTSVVLAGDLNARPQSDAMRVFEDHWSIASSSLEREFAPTYPSKNPRAKIDYVLLRKADPWRAKRVQVIDEPLASDHAPLLAELEHVPAAKALEEDSLEKDYASQLVRTPPKEPHDALGTFQVADGFHLELVAAEPLVADPVAVAFDEHGRMFVIQMRGYSEHGDENLGVVRLLEDTDQDGRFDRGTDYAAGLSWPTAIACYDGGVFVGAAPDILYYKDTDNDGTADIRRVVFSGFGRQNVQGLLNSFIWGLDNRLYGSASSNGGSIRMREHSDRPPVVLRRQDFVMDPTSLVLSAISGGGQHGMSFDQWGNRYVSSNSNHIQWVEFNARYLDRNPLSAPRSATRTIAADGPAAEVFRASPVEPWRLVRTRLRVKGMVGGPVEGGGRAAGYFTGASGVTIYRGDAFPHAFRDDTFAVVGDVGGNLVHLKRVDDDGLTKIARRADDRREFLTSTDNWFRPVQFANGPDGALYVVDMYREVIEHPLSLPPLIKKHLDLTSGRARGRIYRIIPVGFQQPRRPLPGKISDQQLVEMLTHANGWHRETAARMITTKVHKLLDEGGEAERAQVAFFAALLKKLVSDSPSPHARIRALYCLNAFSNLHAETLLHGLRDPHPQVRVHAIRLTETAEKTPTIVRQLQRMADDPDMHVRYQLALSLGELQWPDRRASLLKLARHGLADPKVRFALLSSSPGGRFALIEALWEDEKLVTQAGGIELLTEILRQIGAGQISDFGRTLAFLRSAPSAMARRFITALLEGTGKRGTELVEFVTGAGVDGAGALIDELISEAREQALDQHNSPAERLAATRRLKLAEFHRVEGPLRTLLSARQPPALRSAALQVIGSFRAARAADVLLDAASSLSPAGRHRAFELVCSRRNWALTLLDRIEDDSLRGADLSALHRQQLLQHRDDSIAMRAKALLGDDSGREQIVRQYQSVLKMTGSATRGRELFRKSCEVCHQLDGAGNHVGPDLQPSRNRGAAFMLTNILDPNREVDARYESYIVLNSDGQSFAGIIAAESSRAISLHQADGKSVTIPRSDIEELRSTAKSLMPEGLERELDHQSMADLISYLCTDDY